MFAFPSSSLDDIYESLQDDIKERFMQSNKIVSPDQFLVDDIIEMKVPIPKNEALRLEAIRQTFLLDSGDHDELFDRYVSLASRYFKVISE